MSVGEVTATLKLRDEMSAQYQSAASSVAQSNEVLKASVRLAQQEVNNVAKAIAQLQADGEPAARVMAVLSSEFETARARLAELKGQLEATKASQDDLGKSSELTAQQIRQIKEANEQTGASANVAGNMFRYLVEALAVDKVMTFVTGVIDAGYQLNRLSIQTGISSSGLQALAYEGIKTGTTMDQIALAVSMMQRNIENETPAATRALQMLDLSMRDLQAMTPEEMLKAVAGAMRNVHDHALLLAEGQALMGRNFRSVAGMMQSDMDSLANRATADWAVMSDQTEKALTAQEIRVRTFWAQVKTVAAEGVAYWLEQLDKVRNATPQEHATSTAKSALQGALGVVPMVGPLLSFAAGAIDFKKSVDANVTKPTQDAAAAMNAFVGPIDSAGERHRALQRDMEALLKQGYEPLTASQAQWIDKLNAAHIPEATIAKDVEVSEAAVKRRIETVKEAAKAAEKYAQAEANISDLLSAQGVDWDYSAEEALKYGASARDISIVLGTTAGAIQGIKKELKDEADFHKEVAKAIDAASKAEAEGGVVSQMRHQLSTAAANAEIASDKSVLDAYTDNSNKAKALLGEYYDAVDKDSLSAHDYQIARIREWQDQQEGLLNYSVENWQVAYDRIGAIADARIAALDSNHKRLDETSRTHLQDIADKARDMYEQMKAGDGEWTDQAIRNQGRVVAEAEAAANGTITTWKRTYTVFGDVSSVLGQFPGEFAKIASAAASAAQGIMMGWATGGVYGALAAAATALVGIIKNIGGPSALETAGRQQVQSYMDQLASTLTPTERLAAGSDVLSQSLAGLKKEYMASGLSAQEASTKAQAAMQELMNRERDGGQAIKNLIDGIQGQLDASNAAIAAKAKDVSDSIGEIQSAAQELGGQFPQALKPMVDTLLKLPGLTDAELQSLQALESGGQPSLQQITDTAKKYGITLDDLGKKTQQLDITTKADQVQQDWQMLASTGANVNILYDKFGKSIQDLVTEAIDYGGALPTALQPIIQHLVDSGKLLDANGKKITDISKLTFDDTGDPLAKSFKTLNDTLQHLIDVLTGSLPKAITDIANVPVPSIKIPVTYTITDPSGKQGEASTDYGGAQASGGDYYVTRPTLFLAGEAGPEHAAFGGANGGRPGGGVSAHDLHSAVSAAVRPLADSLDRFMETQPMMIKHALRGPR